MVRRWRSRATEGEGGGGRVVAGAPGSSSRWQVVEETAPELKGTSDGREEENGREGGGGHGRPLGCALGKKAAGEGERGSGSGGR